MKRVALISLLLISCTHLQIPNTPEASVCLRECQHLDNECNAAHGWFLPLAVVPYIIDGFTCDRRYQECLASCFAYDRRVEPPPAPAAPGNRIDPTPARP